MKKIKVLTRLILVTFLISLWLWFSYWASVLPISTSENLRHHENFSGYLYYNPIYEVRVNLVNDNDYSVYYKSEKIIDTVFSDLLFTFDNENWNYLVVNHEIYLNWSKISDIEQRKGRSWNISVNIQGDRYSDQILLATEPYLAINTWVFYLSKLFRLSDLVWLKEEKVIYESIFMPEANPKKFMKRQSLAIDDDQLFDKFTPIRAIDWETYKEERAYFFDKNSVFMRNDSGWFFDVVWADWANFVTLWWWYGKDLENVYYRWEKLPDSADPTTFALWLKIDNYKRYWEDKNHVYDWATITDLDPVKYKDHLWSIEIELEKSTFKAWEFIDLTASKVDRNWNIDTSFTDNIIIFIDWQTRYNENIILPELWFYEFKESDEWSKIFSKKFTIKKPWTYTIEANTLGWKLNQSKTTFIVE